MSFQPWENPDPQSIEGLNSAMVYGENIQFAVGLNHQVALGSNLQLCINPSVLFESLNLPSCQGLSGFWGSGLGGNMQFTIGTSTNVLWGRTFTINMGPEEIKVEGTSLRPFATVVCCLIGAAAILYAIGYGASSDENDRASWVIAFQVLTDLLLATLMIQQVLSKTVDATASAALQRLYGVDSITHKATTLENCLASLAMITILTAAILPPVLISTKEGHFDGETQGSGG